MISFIRIRVWLALFSVLFASTTFSTNAATVRTCVNGSATWSSSTTWVYLLAGSISTNGTDGVVTGSSTFFLSDITAGDMLLKTDGTVLGTVVGSPVSDTQLTLNTTPPLLSGIFFGIRKVPQTGDKVEIGNAAKGGDVDVTLDVNISLLTLKIVDAGANNEVLRLGAQTLTITGDITLQTPAVVASSTNSNELITETGTLNMQNLFFDQNPGAGNAQKVFLRVPNGVANIFGDVGSLGGSGEAQIEMGGGGGSGTLNLYGVLDGFNVFTSGGTNTVAYLGTSNQLVHALPYYNLTIGGARGANSVSFEQGVHAVAGNLDASATFTTGTYTKTGLFTVQFTTNGPQAITGVAGNPLILDNAVLLSATSLTISKDTVVNGDLQLLSGGVISQTNRLLIGATGSVSAANATRYIKGKFEKNFAASSGQLFVAPIGDNTSYTPILVSSLNATQAGSLSFTTATPVHPQVATSGFVNGQTVGRYWTLGASNLAATFNATFIYAPAEVTLGSPDQFSLKRFASGSWFSVQTGSAASGSIEGRALDAANLGDFQAGQIPVVTVAPPQIMSATATPSTVATGDAVQFQASATDPASLPLTYKWDFGDGSIATGNPVSHAFSTEGTLTVTLTVSNGTTSASVQVSVTTLAPNSGGQGIPNISDGDQPVVNPLDDIAISVLSSEGGVLQLQIDINALLRASVSDFNVTTNFDGLGGRFVTRSGIRPVAKINTPGIVVATTEVHDAGTGALMGKARKTIPVSSREVGIAATYEHEPSNVVIVTKSSKGAFHFGAAATGPKAKPDAVTFSGAFDLPAGLDISQNQTFEFCIGNIDDLVTIDSKGKAKLPGTANRITKVQFKYPKLEKGTTKTDAGQSASFTVTLSGALLSDAGFDTDGIASTVRTDEKGKKAVARAVQVAAIFAGVSYKLNANVQYVLSPKGDSGTFVGRAAR